MEPCETEDSEEEEPLFTREELQEKTLPNLIRIARNLGMRPSKKREENIRKILRGEEISQGAHGRILEQLQNSSSSEEPPHHNFYGQNFNPIDLQDGYWYSMQSHHPLRTWKAKLTMSILEIGVVNTYTIFRSFHRKRFLSFVNQLSILLLDSDFSLE